MTWAARPSGVPVSNATVLIVHIHRIQTLGA